VSPARVVLAKPGLDGHDRGIKVVAMALRDAGAEVVYLGLRRSPAEIMRAALDEGADVIGVSVLSGAHLALVGDILRERDEQGMHDVPVVVGGTIPVEDAKVLIQMGAAAVHPVGSSVDRVVETVLALAAERKPA
jgi:methylmalonyl-CoA mutase C-terminal domain/subunit